MEVPRPRAGPGGETIANGHRGNSAGHGSADHMLIGGLVPDRLILKALRSKTHVPGFLAVKISIFSRKIHKDKLPTPESFFFPYECWVAGPHTSTRACTGNAQICALV